MQVILYCKDRCIKIDRNDKGGAHVNEKTIIAFEKTINIHEFQDNICPMGQSSYPFTLEVPDTLRQTSVYHRRWGEFYARYVYYLRA